MEESRQVADDAIEILARFATRVGRSWRDPYGLLDIVYNALYEIEGELDEIGERGEVLEAFPEI
ncbi:MULTISPECIES: hypothetical protein [unclassified Microbacterium]|uniref:hypothetical protein n=1 Tax=unclassified Microbacterium TaxID=2609290 RepID=UPI00260C9444|nr:hypothetical protein [Microbacterium sp.]